MKRTFMAPFAVVCFALVAPVAHAQAKGDAKDAAVADAAAAKPANAGDVLKPTDPKRDRADRRRRAIALTRARWGALVINPPAQAELRLHAQRIAKIDAMEQVARASGKTDLLPRIANLRVKENARFEMRMDYVKNEMDGGPR